MFGAMTDAAPGLVAGAPSTAARRPMVAIAVPLKNEALCVLPMLRALDDAAGRYDGPVIVLVMANDCTDASVDLITHYRSRFAEIDCRAVSMLPGARHAGWARRLAFDAAAGRLVNGDDLLLSTDADTIVSPDWIVRTVATIKQGYDAVAGYALTGREERGRLGELARGRLNQIGRYYTALNYLRARLQPEPGDPWPRHFYEGGASIALTLQLYRRMGGAPTPSLAEDRALFERVRRHGGRIRHPVDVRVTTSCRTEGRAPGGMADAVAQWITQDEDEPLHELYSVSAALSAKPRNGDRLTFRTLAGAHAEARRRINETRRLSPPTPQIEPVAFMPFGEALFDSVPEQVAQLDHGGVPALRIIGLADPMDQQNVAA